MASEISYPPQNGTIAWTCPSNIALIKYWGKKPGQLPRNPSLSMTLKEAYTHTKINYAYAPGQKKGKAVFRFEGREAPLFEERVSRYLGSLEDLLPVLRHTHLEIDSRNSFPHSSGIASSASAMAALALCLVQLEEEVTGPMDKELFWQRASRMARLGSGSASRSVYPKFALWGQHSLWENSSDEYAIPIQGIHESFLSMRDSILVVESGPKKISSSAGHAFMDTHPFGEKRFEQARDNLVQLYGAMKEGDWESFLSFLEEEALTLHALMMTGRPGYILMQPGTLSILQLIREYRKESGKKLGFTLDAGANVHILYADEDATQVESFIHSELAGYCENGWIIPDRIGEGPEKSGP